MCDECEEQKEPVKSFTRRAFMALAAGAAGGLTVGLWSCRPETKKAAPVPNTFPTTTAASETESAVTPPETAPATTTAASAPATSTEPTPDLGSVLFPDIHNRPLATAADAPVIVIPRSDWTHAGPNLSEIRPMNGIARITVHHTAWEWEVDAWTRTAGEIENIRAFHSGTRATDRHWADIAYHFVVDRAGRVWQARPLAYQGAHVKGHNEHNLGIVLLGNFEVQSPTAAQLVSLRGFIGFARGLYHVSLDQVFTHGELGKTSCPGKRLQAYMNRARRAWAVAESVSWSQPTRLDATSPATE
jgi:N-acetylmuramoyl-L-alanine amidase